MISMLDKIRITIISPEMVAALSPFLMYTYLPQLLEILLQPMKESLGFGLTAIAFPLAMLAFNYKECLDMIGNVGTRKILLEWPDYPQLKARMIVSFAWCVVGAIAVISAVFMVAANIFPRLAVAILIAGTLAAATAAATVALARFSLREIVIE